MNIAIDDHDEPVGSNPQVHNHGIDPSCAEHEVNGTLIGDCLRETIDQCLNINQLASHFSKKRYWVGEKLTGRTPAKTGRGGAKFFWLSDVEDILSEGEVQGNATEKSDEQVRKLRAEAGLKELELARKSAEVIAVVDVERGGVELFRSLHNGLNRLATDESLDLSKMSTRGECEKHLKDKFNAMLQALRDDPNNFIAKHINDDSDPVR